MNTKKETKPILIVQGGQWGSEAKGAVAAFLCGKRLVDYAVRTGAVNAGHTAYHPRTGKKYVMQQLPVGWVAGDDCALVIGPGAYVHPDIFFHEVAMVRDAGYKGPIWVDYRAGLHLPEHTERASMAGRHYLIGATGKGCSEAILDRVRLRGKGGQLFYEWWKEATVKGEHPGGWEFTDTVTLLNERYNDGEQLLLEGTQGSLLDLYLGPYPYTTHKQCTAGQWMTEAGLSPSLDYEVVLVARTYPIRVAGNSGPMPSEITWPVLAKEINAKLERSGRPALIEPAAINAFELAYDVLIGQYSSHNVELSERNRDAWKSLPSNTQSELAKLFEFTTVTKKLRRVARLDIESLKYSIMVNRPSWLALTFVNYELPELWYSENLLHASSKLYRYVLALQEKLGVTIGGVSTGPEPNHLFCAHDLPTK